ncbi:SDR family NAD(P)-dependent oxidoreductase [Rhodovastum atsumiense]|uniref:SDR family NAD(P)-dependent oxidoreductase n=1 Tax=Rhodovastum atsumiense TaxID=504468 RepID=A0A5M6IKT2_9PROT|nr:SDR family NAD(P)-dependent oxidoreductase [Rhodovastum atsumiense]KAA5608792.1 SDR family NAD(P)-dependent oxidoreductase [Rhodovastum atsumiense]CAH2600877.1 SDR family NAD(P)-dependent oxidoreductase [Rhodovastum atsumiense]
MDAPRYHTALIVGTGPGLSASLARLFARNGMNVALAARDTTKLAELCADTRASAHACDARDPLAVAGLFQEVQARHGAPDLVIYNASARVRGPVGDLDPEAVRTSIEVSAFGAFLVAQQAARLMLPKGRGAIALTGATAGVKGFAGSAGFAMGKFALRGLAQTLARELGPKGIHVAHFVIDGAIRSAAQTGAEERPDATLDPDAIAESYWQVLHQHRSAWSWEVELRPWVETF